MGRLNRSSWAFVAAVTFACGGKTLDDGTGGTGAASGASGQGVGGTGASGSAGRGGSTGQGGSAGVSGAAGISGATGRGGSTGSSGSPGRGGSAGIPGGSAGVSGSAGVAGTGVAGSGGVAGGSGGVPGGSPEQVIDALCTHYEKSGCGYQNCRMSLKQSVDTYNLWGCGDEWLAGQSCALRDPTPCGGSELCTGSQAGFQQCINDAEICVRGNTASGGCVMGCEEGWAVECDPSPSGGLVCTCTSGRRSGFAFVTTTPCQSEEWQKTIRGSCE